jgi:hypothetical protein
MIYSFFGDNSPVTSLTLKTEIEIFDMHNREIAYEARETATNHNNAGIVIPTVRMISSRKNL